MSYLVYCNSCGSKLKKYKEMRFEASKTLMQKFTPNKDRYTFELRVKGQAS